VDITREAQMILSCVRRIRDKLGYNVGIATVARVLQGSREKKLLQLDLQSLSTYGLMKDMGRTRIRAIADHLEFEGYLITEQEHKTLRLTAKASEILFQGKQIFWLERKEQEALPSTTTVAKNLPMDNDLYEALRELRAELAHEANIPAYMVFSNATLQDMARKKPRTTSEFRRVSGVGELKTAWYSSQFTALICQYLEENQNPD